MRVLFILSLITTNLFIYSQNPIVFNWDNSTEGWVSGGNCNLTAQPGSLAMRLFSSNAVMRSGNISSNLGIVGTDYNLVEVTVKNPTTGSGMARLFLYPPGTNSDTCYYTFPVDTGMTSFSTYTISLDSIPSGGLSSPYTGPIARFGLRAPWGGVNFDTIFWEKMVVSNTNNVVDSAEVTFKLDMSEVSFPFNTPEINGTFNNWCGNCDFMSDVDGDNNWEKSIYLFPGDTIEYKFSTDNYSMLEFLNSNDQCTNGDLNLTNRILVVPQTNSIYSVCWESCEPCVTSVKDYDLEIDIYPNPSRNLIYVKSDNFIGKVVLKDIFGKTVIVETPNDNNFNLDVQNLANNIYFMSCLIDNKWHKRSIVVSH
jgi:hypothetical protein